MFKIKTSLDINGVGWGLNFEHGVAFTDREDLARRLKSLGYEVEESKEIVTPEPPAPNTPEEEPDPTEAPEVAQSESVSEDAEEEHPAESTDAVAPPAPEAPPETASTDSSKLVCPICGKECGSQAVLTRHKNKEHG